MDGLIGLLVIVALAAVIALPFAIYGGLRLIARAQAERWPYGRDR